MKAASISPIALANYSLCDAAGRPRSLFRALPDGTLAAVTQAAKKAEAATLPTVQKRYAPNVYPFPPLPAAEA